MTTSPTRTSSSSRTSPPTRATCTCYYILNEERDFFIDYRARYSGLANGTDDVDNSLSAGVNGRVYGPFNGSIQGGYTVRSTTGGIDSGEYGDFTASGSLTWNMNRRMTLTADLSRDFSTTATAQSIDSTSVGLTFKDSFTTKASASLQVSGGECRFLGDGGWWRPAERAGSTTSPASTRPTPTPSTNT
jgi:hypothetical protein